MKNELNELKAALQVTHEEIKRLNKQVNGLEEERDLALADACYLRKSIMGVHYDWQLRSVSIDMNVGRYFNLKPNEQQEILKQTLVLAIRKMNQQVTHEQVLLEFLKSKQL